MECKLKSILYNVQQNSSCHQKYLKTLEKYYLKLPFEEFAEDFLKCLRVIFHRDITVRNPYVERTLEFLAQFVSMVTKPNSDDPQNTLYDDTPSHPFLTKIIAETLRFHDLIYEQSRYYSCRFITLVLQHIGVETHLDNYICDCIQEAMLERIMDPKTAIRIQAVMALVRLQEPANPECPVVKAYLYLLLDSNPMVRKEVVKRIAPNSITISKICERIRDVEAHVRVAAFSRCADIGPRLFKIITRQQILQCGFKDEKKEVKTVFLENLLPKWLSAYNDNYLDFLGGLKLDADEVDIINTEEICEQVMEVLFRMAPLKDMINSLPVNDQKVVPIASLSSEAVMYWRCLVKFLRGSEDGDDYLDQILPELTPFCNYIQSIIDLKMSKKMEEWEYLEHQYILYNIFDMAEQYDLSDEVGRKALHKLVTSILQNHKLQFRMAKKLVGIADKLTPNVDTLTHDICQIISDIREPLVEVPPPQNEIANRNFQVAELKVKLNILEGDMEEALAVQDFEKASLLKNDLADCRKKLEEVTSQAQVVKVRTTRDDPEVVCRCLDLLGAVMELPSVKAESPSLSTCRTEFLLPLLTSNVVDVNWRVLKCLALYCLLDRAMAEEHVKVLCIPIVTYRAIPNYNKFALMESVSAICDLIRIYGATLFGTEEDVTNTTSSHNSTKRRLYRDEDMNEVTSLENNRMNVEFIIEIILDMLDDENEDIREIAVTALSKLILDNFPVNASLISRIILKWFNPVEKAADKTQQKLGSLISHYTKSVRGAREVIAKAVVPIVSSIANAPRTSPLADIDIDNVLHFLTAVTNSNDTTDIVHIHTNLAHTLCCKLSGKRKDPVVPYLTKMLLHLDIPFANSAAIKELITQVDLLLEDEENDMDKVPKKNLKKFSDKLKAIIRNSTINEQSNQNIESSTGDLSTQGDGNPSQGIESLSETENTISTVRETTNVEASSNDNTETNIEDGDSTKSDGQAEVVNGTKNVETNGGRKEIRRSKRLKVLLDPNVVDAIVSRRVAGDSVSEDDKENNTDTNTEGGDSVNNDKEADVVGENDRTESNGGNGRGNRRSKRLKVFVDTNVVNALIPQRVVGSSVSEVNKKKNGVTSNLPQAISERTESSRNLRSARDKRKEAVNKTNGTNTNNKTNNNTIAQAKEKGRTKSATSEKETQKNQKDKYQNLKRTRRGRHVVSPSEKVDTQTLSRCTRSQKFSSDADTDTSSDVASDDMVAARKSKRLSKSADGAKGNVANGKAGADQVCGNQTADLTNLDTVSMSMTNNSTLKENSALNTSSVKRKKSRGKKSMTPEETILHTIIEHSQQMSILESPDSTIRTRSSISSGKRTPSDSSNRSKTVISETSESESSDSPLRRSSRKIRKTYAGKNTSS